MVRQDIVAALKNAVERGYPIERAGQTLINSGYNAQEVQDGINYLMGGIGGMPQQNQEYYEPPQADNIPQPSQHEGQGSQMQGQNQEGQMDSQTNQMQGGQNMNQEYQEFQQNRGARGFGNYMDNQQEQKEKEVGKKRKGLIWKIALLGVGLVVLIGVLVMLVLYRESVIDFFQNLF